MIIILDILILLCALVVWLTVKDTVLGFVGEVIVCFLIAAAIVITCAIIYYAIKKAKQKVENLGKKKIKIILTSIVTVIALISISYLSVVYYFIPNSEYVDAVEKLNGGKTEEALIGFYKNITFKDTSELVYNIAVDKVEAKEYRKAIDIFHKILNYKDSQEQIVAIETLMLKEAAIGDKVIFGYLDVLGDEIITRYDNEAINDYVEWVVLDIVDNKALLVSDKCLYVITRGDNFYEFYREIETVGADFRSQICSSAHNKKVDWQMTGDCFLLKEDIDKYFPDGKSKTEVISDSQLSLGFVYKDDIYDKIMKCHYYDYTDYEKYRGWPTFGFRPVVWVNIE